MDSVFNALEPSLLVCARGDLWPEMAFAASARRVPVAVISGSVRSSSLRLLPPVRHALNSIYRAVTWLGAASDADALRWSQLGIANSKIAVTGDTRHDQVLERITNLQPIRPLFDWSRGRPVLVAGSTYERDEILIFNAFSDVSKVFPQARAVVVPHDCCNSGVEQVQKNARNAGVEIDVWSADLSDPSASCVVVNTTGMLADIYALAHLAYVGGAFKRGGLHAVSEPAAYALPVVVGPHFSNSTDATLVIGAGGGKALPKRAPETALKQLWLEWLERDNERTATGLKARAVLQQGAADATVKVLKRLL